MKETKSKQTKSKQAKTANISGDPKFPYCTTPNSLRKFLTMAPEKPKPPKVNFATLKVWGLKNTNDQTILRVLKQINFLSSGGEPTNNYAEYMKKGNGPIVLAGQIREVYQQLFENVTSPEKASVEELRNFFNINSGGGEKTIKFQVDTFKALSEFANFNDILKSDELVENSEDKVSRISNPSINMPSMHIDLHIHLPENLSKTDYESIIESIANKIYKI